MSTARFFMFSLLALAVTAGSARAVPLCEQSGASLAVSELAGGLTPVLSYSGGGAKAFKPGGRHEPCRGGRKCDAFYQCVDVFVGKGKAAKLRPYCILAPRGKRDHLEFCAVGGDCESGVCNEAAGQHSCD